MRKTIIVTSLGLALMASAAGAQSNEPKAPEQGRGRGGWNRGERAEGRGPGQFLFKGITLSDAQKNQLKAKREEFRAQHEKTREQNRDVFENARKARQSGDTAAARVALQKLRTEMDGQRDLEIVSLRSVLTAEQQTVFDKNVAELKARGDARGGKFGRGGPDRGGKGEKNFRRGR